MKKIFAILFFTSALSLFALAQTDAVKQYINTYKELAINEEIRTGVPAAITLAQGILESDAGRSDLALSSNNHFGIKCKSDWTGATVYHDDDLPKECFRSYPTVADSYKDHSDFLKSRPNYAFLFNIDPTDYRDWANGLKQAGYATSPVYNDMLIKVINDYGLEEYTDLALNRIKNGNHEDVAMNHANEDAYALNDHQTAGPSGPANTEIVDGNYPHGEFVINQTKVIYASAGTSLFALASNHNIAYKKLLDFNELDKTDILQKDQLIFLERKPKKSITKEYHIVAASETIEDIAQKEGVQLQSLYEYNKMQKGLEPAVGEKVYLRPGKPSYFPKLLAKRK
jgi:LysM repeat protein